MKSAMKATAVVYGAGAVVALTSGLGDLGKVLTAGTYVSIPGPLAAVQLVAAWRASKGSRPATVVLALAMTLSLAAILFDGDFGHAGLSTAQIGFQALQAALIATVAALAWASVLRPLATLFRQQHA
jgi:phage tail protein X